MFIDLFPVSICQSYLAKVANMVLTCGDRYLSKYVLTTEEWD